MPSNLPEQSVKYFGVPVPRDIISGGEDRATMITLALHFQGCSGSVEVSA